MQNKKTLVKALGSVLVGGIILGGVAVAGDKNDIVKKDNNQFSITKQAMKDGSKNCRNKEFNEGKKKELLQQTLDQLFKNGTLDQKKVKEIKSFIDNKNKEKEAYKKKIESLSPEERKAHFDKIIKNKRTKKENLRPNIFNELVKNKIITQEQAKELNNKFQENIKHKQQEKISQALKSLVTKKTITQEQADKVIKEIERQTFLKNKNNKKEFKDRKNPLKRLVEGKVITEKQAKEIKQVLKIDKGFHKGFKHSATKRYIIK